MLIKITPKDISAHTDVMDELFAVRYNEFVLRRNWSDLENGNMRDIDQYDDINTSYIIFEKDASIQGGARIRPTTESHMLEEHFSFLSHTKTVPKGKHIGECSRTFVSRKARNKRETFLEVIIGVVELSIEQEYTQLTGVLETWWLNSYLALGLEPVPLGAPKKYKSLSVMGVKFDVSRKILANLYTLRERIALEDLREEFRKAS